MGMEPVFPETLLISDKRPGDNSGLIYRKDDKQMNGDFKWIKDEKDADFMFGGEEFVITDEDIQSLKNGYILNFFVNMEYGCTLKYRKTNFNPCGKCENWRCDDYKRLTGYCIINRMERNFEEVCNTCINYKKKR